jgi:hypothetical protein
MTETVRVRPGGVGKSHAVARRLYGSGWHNPGGRLPRRCAPRNDWRNPLAQGTDGGHWRNALEASCIRAGRTGTRLLPKEGPHFQYYVRTELDGQQRRAWEGQLRDESKTRRV